MRFARINAVLDFGTMQAQSDTISRPLEPAIRPAECPAEPIHNKLKTTRTIAAGH